MKVMVFQPGNPEEPIGIGDLCRREDIKVVSDRDDKVVLFLLRDHPVIVMEETGEIIYGLDCWWTPI